MYIFATLLRYILLHAPLFDLPIQAVLVHTAETTRVRYFADLLIQNKRPVMLVGNAGTGKTVLVNDKMSQLGDDYMVANIPFNFYTSSEMLQRVLEKPLEKKAGRNYGPPGGKKLIYFIDDLNMPEVGLFEILFDSSCLIFFVCGCLLRCLVGMQKMVIYILCCITLDVV